MCVCVVVGGRSRHRCVAVKTVCAPVIENVKTEDPAGDPEGNLMTLDNMKPERGM